MSIPISPHDPVFTSDPGRSFAELRKLISYPGHGIVVLCNRVQPDYRTLGDSTETGTNGRRTHDSTACQGRLNIASN